MGDAEFDRNLLFGVLALQDELIDAKQFADLCAGWALQPEKSLAELLLDRGWITVEDRSDIERRLDRRLARHGGDTSETLQALAEGLKVRQTLQAVAHPRVRESITAPGATTTVGVDAGAAQTVDLPHESRARYTLAKVHAEGGLGRVWLARDTDLNRDVALKEIKRDRAGNADTRSRFLKEAQITGQLEHPNIVPVYELGRTPDDNQPFYTMRFVRGRTLRAAIAAYHQRRQQGKHEPLEFQKLLSALVAVCQAIGYAHSRGVIHRDLKPENIILGSFGEVIVLDWGLAKLVGKPEELAGTEEAPQVAVSDDAATHRTIGLIGTPAYMAPEQAEARHDMVDWRTDIYGLGAILFEILTGHPPVEAATVSELISKLSSGATREARTVVTSVPAALNAICARAMAVKPSERYALATDLADDLQRWIADEPVTAYPDPFATRVARWGRRHKSTVLSAALFVVAGVIGLVIYNVQIGRARAVAVYNFREAVKQRKLADTERELAEANFRRARDAVEQMLSEVGAVELADVPQLEPVRERLLTRAQRFYLDFLEQAQSDPDVRAEAGRGYCRLGDVEELLGDYPKAEQAYRQSIALLGDEPATRAERARAEHGLGILLKKASRYLEAESALREGLRLREQVSAAAPANPDLEQALGETRYQLGAVAARLPGRRGEEEAAYRAALDVQQRLAAASRGQPARRREVARYLNNLGILFRDTGRRDEAEHAYGEALAIVSELAEVPHAAPGDRWQWAQVSNNLGVLLKETDRPDEAEAAYLKARDLQDELASAFPRVPAYRRGLAFTESNLGLLWTHTGDRAAAERSMLHALDLLQALQSEFPNMPDYHSKLALVRLNLGTMLERSDPDRAETLLRAARTEEEALVAAYPGVPEYLAALGNALFCLGSLRAQRNDLAEARRLLSKAIEDQRLALASDARSPSYRLALCLSYRNYAEVLKRLAAHAELAAAAQELPRVAPDDPDAYRYAAIYLAGSVILLAGDASIAPSAREPLQEEYARTAVDLLREALERRLIRDPRELANPNFDPIRQRNDFQRLLKQLMEQAPQPNVIS
jgi:serine/threonine-protein kinase